MKLTHHLLIALLAVGCSRMIWVKCLFRPLSPPQPKLTCLRDVELGGHKLFEDFEGAHFLNSQHSFFRPLHDNSTLSHFLCAGSDSIDSKNELHSSFLESIESWRYWQAGDHEAIQASKAMSSVSSPLNRHIDLWVLQVQTNCMFMCPLWTISFGTKWGKMSWKAVELAHWVHYDVNFSVLLPAKSEESQFVSSNYVWSMNVCITFLSSRPCIACCCLRSAGVSTWTFM